MSTFNYLKPNRLYNELYYQYPKVFIESDTYKKLSEGSKIAYMLLKARSEIAVLKNQIDENGNLYFEFTGKELAQMMNCSERRVTDIKKELEAFNLLKQRKMGFNKRTGKNEKNRLYLAELEVTDQDIYLMQAREKSAETLDNSGLVNFAQELNNNTSDTNRHLKDTEKESVQDQLLLEDFPLLMKDSSIDTFIPERSLKLIQTFSPTFAQAQDTVRAIHNAKAKAQQQLNAIFVFEELEQRYDIPIETKLYTTLLKAYQKQKTETVENMVNLIFVYCRNLFIDVLHDKAAADQILLREKNQEQK